MSARRNGRISEHSFCGGSSTLLAPDTFVGRYLVREKLAEGGMAEIFLASATGAEGFSKDVVLKMVRPFLSSDPQFVQMFIAEARLASRLNHANIVQIFDFGQHDERYYLAMEYVRGASLWDVRKRCRELGVPFPPTLAAEICVQVARGLQYAHALSDGGRRLGVVHRDVTPHNILVSFDGAVKLTDFGIAKATSSHTAPGMLKGKFAYMSPEQSRGERVDARTDLFALGVVLWEMLTGGRLFDGDTDVAVLRAVQDSLIAPPTRLNPDVPLDLSDVVMKALSRRVEERFQSAAEMERALATFVLNHAQTVDETSVSGFLRQLYREACLPDSEAPLDAEPDPQPPPEDSYGTGDTCFLQRGQAAQGTMTRTPAGSRPARATPRPIKLSRVVEPSKADRRTTPLPLAADGPAGFPARPTEPLPELSQRGTVEMPLVRSQTPGPRRVRFPPSEPSLVTSSKAGAPRGGPESNGAPEPSSTSEHDAEAGAAKLRRSLGLWVAGAATAIVIAAASLALAFWPSTPNTSGPGTSVGAPLPDPTSTTALRPPDKSPSPVGPTELAPPPAHLPEPQEAAGRGAAAPARQPEEAAHPAIPSSSEEPRQQRGGGAPSLAERPEEAPGTAAATPLPTPSRRSPEVAARPVPRPFGRLVVQAFPFALVTIDGKEYGELVGRQVFSLRPGPHDLELVHPQKRRQANVVVRANEETRFEFKALEP